MSVVEMSKLRLIALSCYKDNILDAIHKTGCVEISASEEIADTFVVKDDALRIALSEKYEKAKSVIEFYEERISKSKGQAYYPSNQELLKNQFVTYDEFMAVPEKTDTVDEIIARAESFKETLSDCKSRAIKLNNLIQALKPYYGVDVCFSQMKDTESVKVFFGTVKVEALENVKTALEEFELSETVVLAKNQLAVISVVAINEIANEVDKKLSELGFSKCPFDFEATAEQKIKEAEGQLKEIAGCEMQTDKAICESVNCLRDLKIYTDYYKFLIEKQTAGDGFRRTEKTFLLQGYAPKYSAEKIENAVLSVTDAVFIEFSEPTEEDNPPTLLKNANPVKQSEFVTDMYSPPNYREIDPNKVVFFFFMLFMGVIMADVGYGIMMIVVGLILAARIKVDNGTRRLWNIVALSGVPTIIFGLLFNSFLGFSLNYTALLPNPVPKNGEMDGLMTILLFCLGLGIVHIATGYFCKALNSFRNKDVAGGIFDGLTWVIFFIGMVFAAFNFLFDYLMSDEYVMATGVRVFFDTMAMPGLIMVIGAVFVAMVTAGRREKGFGKFTKGFGAVYGIINIMSDILSYARLFGLMLSGMIIASTFNDMGMGIIAGGGIGYVFGLLVIVVGHVFNIAMGVLGAYIHNSRLQYIEFFGKFYTGEGMPFTPIGSKFDYVYLTDMN